MPTPTYTPLANLTLSGSAASVTFSSISQAYRDLVLVVTGTSAASFANCQIVLNSDAGTNYSTVYMNGDGSTAASGATLSTSKGWLQQNPTFITTTPTSVIASIVDYSASDKHKSWLSRTDRADGRTSALAGRWANTAAITSLQVKLDGQSLAAGSTFALFGIAS